MIFYTFYFSKNYPYLFLESAWIWLDWKKKNKNLFFYPYSSLKMEFSQEGDAFEV